MKYQVVAFDLDDTLAPSKSPLPPQSAQALARLLQQTQVCVISGGQWNQFTSQLLVGLADYISEDGLKNLHLMPTCGTSYYRYLNGKWQAIYVRNLPAQTRQEALQIIEETARKLGLWEVRTWGEILEDRGTQITFSALGQAAPLSEKRKWDPQGEKKNRLRDALIPQLPELEVRSGGSTSVDITAKGVDKAYGIAQLLQLNHWQQTDLVFIGDRLDPAGNDYPVKAAGYRTLAVTGWEDTVSLIEQLLQEAEQ